MEGIFHRPVISESSSGLKKVVKIADAVFSDGWASFIKEYVLPDTIDGIAASSLSADKIIVEVSVNSIVSTHNRQNKMNKAYNPVSKKITLSFTEQNTTNPPLKADIYIIV